MLAFWAFFCLFLFRCCCAACSAALFGSLSPFCFHVRRPIFSRRFDYNYLTVCRYWRTISFGNGTRNSICTFASGSECIMAFVAAQKHISVLGEATHAHADARLAAIRRRNARRQNSLRALTIRKCSDIKYSFSFEIDFRVSFLVMEVRDLDCSVIFGLHREFEGERRPPRRRQTQKQSFIRQILMTKEIVHLDPPSAH